MYWLVLGPQLMSWHEIGFWFSAVQNFMLFYAWILHLHQVVTYVITLSSESYKIQFPTVTLSVKPTEEQ